MATTYRQPGEVLSFVAAANLESGDVAALGQKQAGIVQADVAQSAEGELHVVGVHALPKATGSAAVAGSRAWWDGTEVVMAPAAGAYFIGHFTEAAGSSAAVCEVKLAASFAEEGARLLTMAATGNQSVAAADLLCGELTLLVPNTEALEIALPSVAAVPPGAKLRVRKTAAAAAAVTLNPAGTEQIAGGATHAAIDANNDTALFQSTGAAWALVDSAIA